MAKVSVVISTYNGEKYIKECVTSILSQTFQDFEIIIVDDQSVDNTVKIIETMQSIDSRIRLFINACHNHSDALNIGLQYAKGDYIARIDQDDIMVNIRLMRQVTYMERHKDIDVCCSWFKTFGHRNQYIKIAKGDIEFPEYQLLVTNIFPNPTAMIKKSFLSHHNIRYNNQYQYAEDYALWIDCALAGAKFHIIPHFLQKYRIHDFQCSITHSYEQYHETLKMRTFLINELLTRHKSWHDVINVIKLLWNASNKDMISIETVFKIANELFTTKSKS